MDLVRLYWEAGNLKLSVSIWLITFAILIGLIVYFSDVLNIRRKVYDIDEAEIGVGNQKVKIRPNYGDTQIAYKLWVEVSTRKIGLPIDFENDVIYEVYNSWYEFFKITRELIKDIPVNKINKSDSTKKLVNVAIDVLNEGLRPHLTLWQAKFRKWYDIESLKEEHQNVSPQELQKLFPQYQELIDDMRHVNNKLMKYRIILRRIALDD